MIELYLAEKCPYCVKVRNFMEDKGISYILKPVVLGNRTNANKEELMKLGGKIQVPFLVDTVNKVQMYESDDIIRYVEKLSS